MRNLLLQIIRDYVDDEDSLSEVSDGIEGAMNTFGKNLDNITFEIRGSSQYVKLMAIGVDNESVIKYCDMDTKTLSFNLKEFKQEYPNIDKLYFIIGAINNYNLSSFGEQFFDITSWENNKQINLHNFLLNKYLEISNMNKTHQFLVPYSLTHDEYSGWSLNIEMCSYQALSELMEDMEDY